MCIKKGMYGLKQASIMDNQELVKHMAPFGYHPVKHTPRLWVHESRKTLFSLVVDNLCVQYCSTEDSEHFFNALRSKYLITVNMAATVYICIKLKWDYVHRTVIFSMTSYVRKALRRFQHTCWKRLVYLSERYSAVSKESVYWNFCPYLIGAQVWGDYSLPHLRMCWNMREALRT